MNRDTEARIEQLNSAAPAIIRSLGGRVLEADKDKGRCLFEFHIGEEFCHSGNIVQGGIVTAMLDAAMSHAVFVQQADVLGLSTLDIRVSFLEPSLAGRFTCRGSIRRGGYKIAFLEGELYDDAGTLTGTASATAKINR